VIAAPENMAPEDAELFREWHDAESRLATARGNLENQRLLAIEATFADGGARGDKLVKLIQNLRGAGLDLKLQEASLLRTFPGLDRGFRKHWQVVEAVARKAEAERIAVLEAISDTLGHTTALRHKLKAEDVTRLRAAAEARDAQRQATDGLQGRGDIASRLAELRKEVAAAF